MGLKKLWPNAFGIAPIELKLCIWIKDGKVYITIKFQENVRTLKFCAIYVLHYIFHHMIVKNLSIYL